MNFEETFDQWCELHWQSWADGFWLELARKDCRWKRCYGFVIRARRLQGDRQLRSCRQATALFRPPEPKREDSSECHRAPRSASAHRASDRMFPKGLGKATANLWMVSSRRFSFPK